MIDVERTIARVCEIGRAVDRSAPSLRARNADEWLEEVVSIAAAEDARIVRKGRSSGLISPDTFGILVTDPGAAVLEGGDPFVAVSIIRDHPAGGNEWRGAPDNHGIVRGQYWRRARMWAGSGAGAGGAIGGSGVTPAAPGLTVADVRAAMRAEFADLGGVLGAIQQAIAAVAVGLAGLEGVVGGLQTAARATELAEHLDRVLEAQCGAAREVRLAGAVLGRRVEFSGYLNPPAKS